MLLLVMAAASPAGQALPLPASGERWRVTGQIGGPTMTVAVRDSLTLVGVGYRLAIWDVAQPAAPRELGATPPLGDRVLGIAVSGTMAYAAAGSAGLFVVDITDPASPAILGHWDSPGSAEGIAVVGDHAYLADGPFGVRVVDVSDPARPVPAGSAFDMSFAFDIVVQGEHAFVAAAGAGLLVADVSDPHHPREVAGLDTPGFARDVIVAGSIVYLADAWGGIRTFDIAAPERPVELASLVLPSWAYGVALSGSTLLVADGSQGLRAVDVADPRHPVEIGAYAVPWVHHSSGVAAAGGLAYLVVRDEGLHLVDLASPAQPVTISVIDPLVRAGSVAVAGNVAFVAAASQGLRVVTLDGGPREIGRLDLPGAARVVQAGTHLAVGGGDLGGGRLAVVDSSVPGAPREVGSVRLRGMRDIAATGSLVLVAEEAGLQVVDIADPAHPEVVGVLDDLSGGATNSVAVSGTLAIVTGAGDGAWIVDLADPRHPVLRSTYVPSPSGGPAAVAAGAGYAYILTHPGGLRVVSLDDPADPREVAALALPGLPEWARLDGTTLLIAGGDLGLIEVDVSEPSAPRIVSLYRTPGYTSGVAWCGERIVLASGEGGLVVLERSDEGSAATRGASAPSGGDPAAALRPPGAGGLPGDVRRRLLSGLPRAAAVTSLSRRGAPDQAHASASRGAPQVLTVTSTADAGPGTLREALATAWENDTITFDPAVFPPAAPAAIKVKSLLACPCRDRVTVDASNAGVILDGSEFPGGGITQGLGINTDGNRVMGLQITGFTNGMIVGGADNVIGGDRSNGGGPSGEGNVVSRNTDIGIGLSGQNARSNRVIGNLVGTDATGTTGLGGQAVGILVHDAGPGNVIGGWQAGEANVVSGSKSELIIQSTRGQSVIGNRIGTDPTGRLRVGAGIVGIGSAVTADNLIAGNIVAAGLAGIGLWDIGSRFNRVVGNRVGVGSDDEVIATTGPAAREAIGLTEGHNLIADNLIGGNLQQGLALAAAEVVAVGNRIGSDPVGSSPRSGSRGSVETGVVISSGTQAGPAVRTFFGGASPGEGNVVSGATGTGVSSIGPGVRSVFILGNLIGAAPTGTGLPGNAQNGLNIAEVDGAFVQGNTITGNGGAGVGEWSSTAVRLRRNSVYANGALGLDIFSPAAPSPPAFTTVTSQWVAGTACAGCVVEVFSDLEEEGRVYEGTATAGPDGAFTLSTAPRYLVGRNVTATATDAAGATSAFSAPAPVPRQPRRRLRSSAATE